MPNYTPEQYAARLRRWSRGRGAGSLAGAIEDAAREAADVIAGTSIGQYMRDAGAGAGRRSAKDRGPLRIVTGTLARAVRAPDKREGSIREITKTESGVQLEMGVSLDIAKGGYNEGRKAKSGRDLSFLAPAVDASGSRIQKRAAAIVAGSFLAHVGADRGSA